MTILWLPHQLSCHVGDVHFEWASDNYRKFKSYWTLQPHFVVKTAIVVIPRCCFLKQIFYNASRGMKKSQVHGTLSFEFSAVMMCEAPTYLEWNPHFTVLDILMSALVMTESLGSGVLPDMAYIGMYGPKGYGFPAVLVINKVPIFDILPPFW